MTAPMTDRTACGRWWHGWDMANSAAVKPSAFPYVGTEKVGRLSLYMSVVMEI